MIRTGFLLLAFGLVPVISAAASCENCYQDGLDAQQRGELEHALSSYMSGCDQDDGAACNAASHMLAKGEGAPADSSRAVSLGFRACDLGHWQGCRDLGVSLIRAENPEIAAKGRDLLVRACEGGSAPGCGALGISMLRGYGGAIDRAGAMQILARSCELGFAPGCTKYGAYLFAGDAVDPARARSLVQQACYAGDAEGCGYLGVAMRDGIGGPADAAGANRYLERACEAGFLVWCSELAAALVKGTGGIEVDIPRAVDLFKTACEGGWQKACENAEMLAKAMRKEPAREQDAGWSTSVENFSFSTRKEPTADDGSQASTTIGSMQIGQGSETATFSDVRSSCGVLELTLAFGSAAAPVRQCLGDSDTRRVTLAAEDGRIVSLSVDPDDNVGRCVASALGRAHIEGLTCSLEASISR